MLSAGGLRFPKLQNPSEDRYRYRLDWSGFPRVLPERYERELEEAVFMLPGDDDELVTITHYACRASEETAYGHSIFYPASQAYVRAAFSFLGALLRRPD